MDEHMDIIDVIQSHVNKIVKDKYKRDKCPPQFIVSVYYELDDKDKYVNNHKILLTVVHNELAHTHVIFPNKSYKYGYESISKEMEWLYNSTM